MSKLKKVAYPADNNQFIYVAKKAIDGISKKAFITKQYTVGGTGGKLVIEYADKKGNSHGVMELYDMGEKEPKNKKE